MLIPFETILKYNLKVNGVIHVGAHHGEELEDYLKHGFSPIVFIEPCAEAFSVLMKRCAQFPQVRMIHTACGSARGTAEMFTETINTGQSNSLLKPKGHLVEHPDIKFEGKEMVEVVTLDSLHCAGNFMNIDVQGYELEVLKGATETLKQVDYIYTEINRADVYEGCALVEELDAFLHEFERVETRWASRRHNWGDGFYIRKS